MANNTSNTCTYREGPLPACQALAVPMVPAQQSSQPAYDSGEALAKGTLFPGLDLPFMDYVATGPAENTPLGELMALDFVLQELALYLDTHPEDSEAFKTWKSFASLAEKGRKRYVELYGPVTRRDTAGFNAWVWPEDPWPWDNGGKGGKC
ncbi:MAG: spore coat protein CotJB [Oscillospiraceae bacterium]|nr:spore coat protein CotJB [Oscillospiraceae bacterium]